MKPHSAISTLNLNTLVILGLVLPTRPPTAPNMASPAIVAHRIGKLNPYGLMTPYTAHANAPVRAPIYDPKTNPVEKAIRSIIFTFGIPMRM